VPPTAATKETQITFRRASVSMSFEARNITPPWV
jgi:hypothetical protein